MTRGSPPPKEKPPAAEKHRGGQHGRCERLDDTTRSPGIPGDREKNLGAVLRRTLGRIAGNVEVER